MSSFESRFERMELKYLIDEITAERVRRDVEPYCAPDSHNPATDRIRSGGPRGYQISSLYLDSPGLAFFYAKERGDADRMKLRVRGYGGSPHAVLERKRRVADVIDKTRVTVDRKDVELASMGLVDLGPDNLEASHFLSQFASMVACSGAEPTLLLRYEREAYASDVDHYARVTFDRNIEAQRSRSWDLDPQGGRWTRFDEYWRREDDSRRIVLELKCQSCIPWWLTDLIRKHALKLQSFSKYSIGIHLTGLERGANLVARRSARRMR
jgi:SPX domain protein involved in polyphosphate accumulation